MAQVSARERSPRCTLWTRLDSRLRGNDALGRGEWFVVEHERLCFNVTGYYQTLLIPIVTEVIARHIADFLDYSQALLQGEDDHAP